MQLKACLYCEGNCTVEASLLKQQMQPSLQYRKSATIGLTAPISGSCKVLTPFVCSLVENSWLTLICQRCIGMLDEALGLLDGALGMLDDALATRHDAIRVAK